MKNTCLYKVAATKTFRLSSTKLFGKHGSNLQNIEKSLRQIYIPDDDKIFVQVDQSGAEALCVAYSCPSGEYRKLFRNKIKPHSFLAMRLFKDIWSKKMVEHNYVNPDSDFNIDKLVSCPIENLKQQPYFKDLMLLIKSSDDWSLSERYYYLAKQTEHMSNYGCMPPKFRMTVLEKSGGKIVITKEQSELFLNTKYELFPEIKEGHRMLQRQVEQTKMLYNMFGHPYQITKYEILDSDWAEFYAWPHQSTVGEITNIAYTRMQNFIEQNKRNWDLLANTHDSYLLQCPIGEEVECATQAKSFMEQKFKSPVDDEPFQMGSEAAVGYNWAPQHDKKNPNGLKEIKL